MQQPDPAIADREVTARIAPSITGLEFARAWGRQNIVQ